MNMTYNKKTFIAPDSVSSMSAIHCKIQEGRAIVRLSDCHGSIKLHNAIDSPEEKNEMIIKLASLINQLSDFYHFLNENINP